MTTIPRDPDDDDGTLKRIFDPETKERIAALGRMTTGKSPDELAAMPDNRRSPDDLPDGYFEAAAAEIEQERWESFAPWVYREASLDWPKLPTEARDELIGWRDAERPGNVLITGPVGCGKTTSLLAACRPIVATGRRVVFTSAARLMMDLRPGGPEGYYRELVNVPLLILDDVGVEKGSEFTIEQLATIIDERWQEGLPTAVTTNLSIDGTPSPFEERIGSRAFSRLARGERTTVLILDGPDYRSEG